MVAKDYVGQECIFQVLSCVPEACSVRRLCDYLLSCVIHFQMFEGSVRGRCEGRSTVTCLTAVKSDGPGSVRNPKKNLCTCNVLKSRQLILE